MIASLGALLRVSLRRSRADWPIVLAAGLMCTLAASLLAAGVMYASAVSVASLHRTLADAPVTGANLQLTSRIDHAAWPAVDATLSDELRGTLGPVAPTIDRFGRTDSFALPEQPAGGVRDLVTLEFLEGIERDATLSAGAWPADIAEADTTVPVAVSENVARPLGLEVGRRLSLQSRLDPNLVVDARVAAIFRIDDPGSVAWWNDPQVLEGVQTSEPYVTFGPFFTTRANMLSRAATGTIQVGWRAIVDPDLVTPDDIHDLSLGVAGIGARAKAAIGDGTTVTVSTDLPAILDRVERSLLASRAGIVLLTIQLAILATYAVLLSAALVVEHRRLDTSMLRSRGAGPLRVAELAAIEGVVLVGVAALIAPWLAVAALSLFDVVGPFAEIGLHIEPTVTIDAYVAAGAAALLCLLALTLPALLSARQMAGVSGGLARGHTRSLGQRLGLDIALLAVAAIGIVQLRQYGAPLTRSVQGTLGLDPLLVATPAIGLLAGAILALRLIPLTAGLLERVTGRDRGLVPSLGARQLARRPLRYSRAALLLTLAMAMGVFAVSYAATWTTSQRDQADYQVGADVRVVPSRRGDAPERWTLDAAYGAIPGVTARMPVDRESIRLSTSKSGSLVGLDATSAPTVVTLRRDLAEPVLADLMAPLVAGRPAFAGVRLPGEPRSVRLVARLDIRRLVGPEGPDQSVDPEGSVDPASIADLPGMGISIVVRDAHGALSRFSGPPSTLGGTGPVTIELGSASSGSFVYPLEVLAIEVAVGVPSDLQVMDATLSVAGLEAFSAGTWQTVALAPSGGWRPTAGRNDGDEATVPVTTLPDGFSVTIQNGEPPGLLGMDFNGQANLMVFTPSGLAAVDRAVLPVIATDQFLEATAQSVGEDATLTIDGVQRQVHITNAMRAFPTTDADSAIVLMDLPSLSLLRFAGSGSIDPPEEWWLAVADGQDDAVANALRAAPLRSDSVVSRTARTLALASDPVALGVIGVLAIGFVAAASFAVLGFVISAAVSARERVTEFALLRALGLSGGQLSAWLSLENATLAIISLVAGTLLGLLMAWVVLPFVTVTQGASTPVPPVEMHVPWTTIAALVAISAIVLAIAVVVLAWLLRRIGLASVLRMGED